VTIALDQLVVLGLLTASMHWLVARSTIAKPLWSRARGPLAELLKCAGCTGWWLGLGCGFAGLRPIVAHYQVVSIVVAGVLGAILTPIFEGVMVWGLLQSTIDESDD
jgi:hypothetical protein